MVGRHGGRRYDEYSTDCPIHTNDRAFDSGHNKGCGHFHHGLSIVLRKRPAVRQKHLAGSPVQVPHLPPNPHFRYVRPHDVYHSFPALFCAGNSRISKRSFVTWLRRSGVAA